jgi:hypothetical protein
VQELVKGVLGVLARERQDAAVALLLQSGHLGADVIISQRGTLFDCLRGGNKVQG